MLYTGHYHAYHTGRILHRDISESNLMIFRPAESAEVVGILKISTWRLNGCLTQRRLKSVRPITEQGLYPSWLWNLSTMTKPSQSISIAMTWNPSFASSFGQRRTMILSRGLSGIHRACSETGSIPTPLPR